MIELLFYFFVVEDYWFIYYFMIFLVLVRVEEDGERSIKRYNMNDLWNEI